MTRCGLMVYPTYAAPYRCFQRATTHGLCKNHYQVSKKRLAKAGLRTRKERSDKGVGIIR